MELFIEQLLNKMGLHDEPNVLEKTTELVRLLELRACNVPVQVNEYGKVVLCADLAAVMLGIAFDKENALKLSGLRKTHYANHKRMFEKLLDLTKIVTVNDICIQLSLNELSRKAEELLELYKSIVATESADIDMSHPQYAAMAVYQSGKLSKKKISKAKIQSFSNLRPAQWTQLEQRWDKFLVKHYSAEMTGKLKKTAVEAADAQNAASDKQKLLSGAAEKRTKLEVEDYEKWKQRILQMAEQQLQNALVQKENIESN